MGPTFFKCFLFINYYSRASRRFCRVSPPSLNLMFHNTGDVLRSSALECLLTECKRNVQTMTCDVEVQAWANGRTPLPLLMQVVQPISCNSNQWRYSRLVIVRPISELTVKLFHVQKRLNHSKCRWGRGQTRVCPMNLVLNGGPDTPREGKLLSETCTWHPLHAGLVHRWHSPTC